MVCLAIACGSLERPWGDIVIGPGEPILLGIAVDQDESGAAIGAGPADADQIAGEQIDGHPIQVVPVVVHCAASTPAAISPASTDLAPLVGYIGGVCSSACLYAEPLLFDQRTTMISAGCTSAAITQQGFSTVFGIAWNDDDQARVAADYAHNGLRVRRVAVIRDTSAYARSMTAMFASQFRDDGGSVTEVEIPVTGAVNIAEVAARVKASGAGAVFFAVGRDDSPDVFAAVQPVIGSLPAIASDTVLGRSGVPPANGLVAVGLARRNGAWVSELDSGAASPNLFEGQTLDAQRLYASALNKVAAKHADGSLVIPRQKLRNALSDINLTGTTGRLSFDSQGERRHDIGAALYRIDSGKATPLMQYRR